MILMTGAILGAILFVAVAAFVVGIDNGGKPSPETAPVAEGAEIGEGPLLVDAGASSAPTNELAVQAEAILRKSCHRCHGDGGSNEGGFNYVLNLEQLKDDGFIVGGDVEGSYLMERVLGGTMPPRGEEPRPSQEELDILSQWISEGAADFAAPLQRPFITIDDMYAYIKEDLSNANPQFRKHRRYFSLVHLYNANVSEDEMQTYRLALAKLLNSLSREHKLVKPAPIDPHNTLLRIDLRDLQWNEDIWTTMAAASPYATIHDSADAVFCQKETGECQVPFLRVDWFVFAGSKPPLYHEALQIPKTLKELEADLDIDTQKNILEDRAVRAGFIESGVSRHNRLIERHPLRTGAFWISYDFDGSAGAKNLMTHPLGPNDEPHSFKHAGGEIIFNLPNGLQGYMLVDDKGNRIDEGPQNIVLDPRSSNAAVINGVSCMSCHYAGIIQKSDEVLQNFENDPSVFAAELRDQIRRLYQPEKINQFQREDAARFQNAMKELGFGEITEKGEPVFNMSNRFTRSLDLKLAAAEYGLQIDDFKRRVAALSDTTIKGILQPVISTGTIKREVFRGVYPDALEAFGLGKPFNAKPKKKEEVAVNPPSADAKAPTPTPTPPAGELRLWKDLSGKDKFTAKLLGMEKETIVIRQDDGATVNEAVEMVTLKTADGTDVKEPIASFSEADQQFIRSQSLSPPGIDPALPEEPAPDAPVEGDYRLWTDWRGKPLRAALFKIRGDVVLLRKVDGKLAEVPFGWFSAEDKLHLRKIMSKPLPPKTPAPAKPPAGPERGEYHLWRPLSVRPFLARFLLLQRGVVTFRLAEGGTLKAPLDDMCQEDLALIRSIVGDGEFRRQSQAPEGEPFEVPLGDSDYHY